MGPFLGKFHPYPISNLVLIPFLRSNITFPGKDLLTPEKVAGVIVFFDRGFLSGFVSCVYTCHKINIPLNFSRISCLFMR